MAQVRNCLCMSYCSLFMHTYPSRCNSIQIQAYPVIEARHIIKDYRHWFSNCVGDFIGELEIDQAVMDCPSFPPRIYLISV